MIWVTVEDVIATHSKIDAFNVAPQK